MTTTRKCPECAEEILAEARKCKHCGSQVQPLRQGTATAETRQKPGCLGSIVRVVFGVVGFFVAVGFVFWCGTKIHREAPETTAIPNHVKCTLNKASCAHLKTELDTAEVRLRACNRAGKGCEEAEQVMDDSDFLMSQKGCYR